jgi:hypothetical protein
MDSEKSINGNCNANAATAQIKESSSKPSDGVDEVDSPIINTGPEQF